MGYVKVVKNNSYFKNFQVKFRRRRQCKTNYRIRRRLIKQDKRKYNTPKWRLIVRITNRDVICQIACAKMVGDQIICAAYSHELKRYGLKVGLTNYAACYCTGLLCARRMLRKLGLDKIYKGKKYIDGNLFKSSLTNIKAEKWGDLRVHRPFKCIMDLGLVRAARGARVFGAMKGAIDGGLDVPHSNKRFPGFVKATEDGEKDEYHPDVLRAKIFGENIAKYMRLLQENDPDKYQTQFRSYVNEGVGPDDLEGLYELVHSKIRQDPGPWPKKERDWRKMDVRVTERKRTTEERHANRLERIDIQREKNRVKAEAKAARRGGHVQQQQQQQQQQPMDQDSESD